MGRGQLCFLPDGTPHVIKHVGHHFSRQIVCQRLDQPTHFHRYATTQGDRLQLDVYPPVALFKPVHNQSSPDVSRRPSLRESMLTGLAIIGDFLYADGVCRNTYPVGGWPRNLDLEIVTEGKESTK